VFFATCRHEFGNKHDEWMSIVKPDLHPAVAAQLHEKFDVSEVEIENSKSVRGEMRAAVNSLLKVIIYCAPYLILNPFDVKSISMMPHSNFSQWFILLAFLKNKRVHLES
jgi:hypothetical protein